ncbi:MAG: beta-N-acetylhexosaminidase [Bacteroidales bacterium]|nr:beta-N-acetylhexosaminidase [Bacteroidales bacterium]
MKISRLLMGIIPILFLSVSCQKTEETTLKNNSIIPKPQQVRSFGEAFLIKGKTKILYNSQDESVAAMGAFLSESIKDISDIELGYAFSETSKNKNAIYLSLQNDEEGIAEAYTLDISKHRIQLTATNTEGLFRGIQTFVQLLSLENSDLKIEDKGIMVPTGVINDYPEYEYRGMMLDVSRHFFPPTVVKQLIDKLAFYKINVLHLHLSDDQGWRIEIKSWPKLTEIGGSTEVGGGEGGFYTQEQYKDLVQYAAERFITIVPEIDMPGHTNAALASYAELNCNGKATELYTGTKVGFSTLCTDDELTYKFVDDVVREISEMTPGPYFHIGGDESHVTKLPDYIYFVDRVKEIVKAHGKTLVGWDEISHGALSEGDVAQYWSSSENALRATTKGAKLIISPAKKCYLDMKYHEKTELGLNWAAYIEVDAAYNWNPVELVEGIQRDDILGIESPLWAETIESLDDIEYLAFPRIIGHAEIGWSNADSLSWDDYERRLAIHGKLLDKMGVDFYKSEKIEW